MDEHGRNPTKQPYGVFPMKKSEGVLETTQVSQENILERLQTLEIHEWKYGSEGGSDVEHIGPAAEDFYGMFGLGEDAEHIATGDADGVALAAIKELASRLNEYHALTSRQERQLERQRKLITTQRDDIEALRERIESIQTMVTRLRRQLDDRG